jgi:hypothetical protein
VKRALQFGPRHLVQTDDELELRVQFGQGPQGDSEVPRENAIGTRPVALRNIRGHRHRGPADLLTQAVALISPKPTCDSVTGNDKIHRHTPRIQVLEGPNRPVAHIPLTFCTKTACTALQNLQQSLLTR